MNPTPNKDHDPQQDSNRMLNQVTEAFSLPWPRKPHGKPTNSPGGKGPAAPRMARAARPQRRSGPKRQRRNSAA